MEVSGLFNSTYAAIGNIKKLEIPLRQPEYSHAIHNRLMNPNLHPLE